MTIGDQIRRYRLAAGLNAKDVAERAGISRGYMSEIENNVRRMPSAPLLARIAEAIGVSVQDLMDPQPPPVRCKHWSIQWTSHPGGSIECMSCGHRWTTHEIH